jgi:hypothetical protein
MEMYLHDDSGDTTLTYKLEVTLTTEWKPYSYSLRDFKPAGAATKGTTMAPGRISSFTIEPNSSSTQILELQIDTLRVESSKPAK